MSALFESSTTSWVLWVLVKASILMGATAFVQITLGRYASAATRHLAWTLAAVGLLVLPVASRAMPEWAIPIPIAPAAQESAAPISLDTSLTARGAWPPPRLRPNLAEAWPEAARHAEADPPPRALRASRDGLTALPAAARHGSAASLLDGAGAPPPRHGGSLGPRALADVTIWTVGLYFTGVIVLLAHLFLQHLRMRRFVGRAATVDDPEWQGLLASCARSTGVRRHVRLLRSPERTMPMTLGTRRASIVIPSIADTWDEDRRRAVLMHELAHVARYDCLTQALAIVTRAVYWCHPGAWWIVRRLRIERELACDDRVIAAGTEAKEYAGHLLEIAYSFRRHRAPVLAVSMARPSQLEGRMLAVLDAARNRSRPTRLVRLAGGAAAVMLVLGLAAARPTALAGGTPVTALPSTEPGVAPEPGPADVDAASARPKETAGVSARRVKEAAAPAAVAQDGVPGTWEIRPSETKGMVQLRLVELRSSSSTNVPIEQLQGLSSAQLTGAGGPVTFRVKRDAGTFTFEGVLRNGVGAGTFSFAPDANFPAELAKRGFARPSGPEQYQLARHDIGFAFLDELTRQGYAKPQTADLVRAGQHGVQTTYLREMGALGYRLGSLDPLITLRDHGVSPNYIRELADLGYKGLAADDLRQARDHGVSPEYVRGMRDAGYTSIPMPELVRLRDHGVSPEFVKELGDAGQRKVALDQLVRLRDHGVSPEYVREMTKLGYSLSLDQLVNARDHGVSLEYAREMKALGYSLPIDGLVQARDHGVSVEYVRAMAALGYTGLPMETLIRLRDHGVSAQYAEELKALGYDKVAFEDLITLRDHGLSVERIKAANARAGTRLPIDLLKSLASGGMR